MANASYSRIIRDTSEELAAAWLLAHGYCDCAVQQQAIARQLLPVVAMFEKELSLTTYASLEDFKCRMAVYLTRAHDTLKKGLHRAGESASWFTPGSGNADHGALN